MILIQILMRQRWHSTSGDLLMITRLRIQFLITLLRLRNCLKGCYLVWIKIDDRNKCIFSVKESTNGRDLIRGSPSPGSGSSWRDTTQNICTFIIFHQLCLLSPPGSASSFLPRLFLAEWLSSSLSSLFSSTSSIMSRPSLQTPREWLQSPPGCLVIPKMYTVRRYRLEN